MGKRRFGSFGEYTLHTHLAREHDCIYSYLTYPDYCQPGIVFTGRNPLELLTQQKPVSSAELQVGCWAEQHHSLVIASE